TRAIERPPARCRTPERGSSRHLLPHCYLSAWPETTESAPCRGFLLIGRPDLNPAALHVSASCGGSDGCWATVGHTRSRRPLGLLWRQRPDTSSTCRTSRVASGVKSD